MMTPRANPGRGATRTAFACAGLAIGMIGLAFASVPLYDAFCKATGYDGTPASGSRPRRVGGAGTNDSMVVHFDTNVAPGLWRGSSPPRRTASRPRWGRPRRCSSACRTPDRSPSTGVATFNVQPGLMGSYFVKIACFCFNEQTLQPGETLDVPVVFYVDPAVRDDSNTAHLSEMTLSYTYFAAKNGQPVTGSVANSASSGIEGRFLIAGP